jgi:hypothetical protein
MRSRKRGFVRSRLLIIGNFFRIIAHLFELRYRRARTGGFDKTSRQLLPKQGLMRRERCAQQTEWQYR